MHGASAYPHIGLHHIHTTSSNAHSVCYDIQPWYSACIIHCFTLLMQTVYKLHVNYSILFVKAIVCMQTTGSGGLTSVIRELQSMLFTSHHTVMMSYKTLLSTNKTLLCTNATLICTNKTRWIKQTYTKTLCTGQKVHRALLLPNRGS